MYEGGHRVPAFARWPGKITPGTQSDETVLSMDVLPTLVDITGGTIPEGIDGVSFKTVLFNNETLPERPLFWKFRRSRVIRKGDWKLIITKNKDSKIETELFNLKNDISEKENLADREPDKVAKMQKELDQWVEEVSKK